MKKSTLVAFTALFGLLGLFTSGCSDDTLSCSEVDAGVADAPVSGGPDLAGSSPANVADAPAPTDVADAPASGEDGGAGEDGGGGTLDLGDETGGTDSGATTDASSATDS
jgi:hypothetical protein